MIRELPEKDRLDRHYETFLNLVKIAQGHHASRRPNLAATWAQVAARFAWFNPTGLFASGDLEAVLNELGTTLSRNICASPKAPAGTHPCERMPGSVLHVITQA